MQSSGFTLFSLETTRFGFEAGYCLVTDYDGWSAQFRDRQGLTGMKYDGMPTLHPTFEHALAAYHNIDKDVSDHRITGVYEGGPTGANKLIHTFPRKLDSVEGYDDAGSW